MRSFTFSYWGVGKSSKQKVQQLLLHLLIQPSGFWWPAAVHPPILETRTFSLLLSKLQLTLDLTGRLKDTHLKLFSSIIYFHQYIIFDPSMIQALLSPLAREDRTGVATRSSCRCLGSRQAVGRLTHSNQGPSMIHNYPTISLEAKFGVFVWGGTKWYIPSRAYGFVHSNPSHWQCLDQIYEPGKWISVCMSEQLAVLSNLFV